MLLVEISGGDLDYRELLERGLIYQVCMSFDPKKLRSVPGLLVRIINGKDNFLFALKISSHQSIKEEQPGHQAIFYFKEDSIAAASEVRFLLETLDKGLNMSSVTVDDRPSNSQLDNNALPLIVIKNHEGELTRFAYETFGLAGFNPYAGLMLNAKGWRWEKSQEEILLELQRKETIKRN